MARQWRTRLGPDARDAGFALQGLCFVPGFRRYNNGNQEQSEYPQGWLFRMPGLRLRASEIAQTTQSHDIQVKISTSPIPWAGVRKYLTG
jgi:hypothetical protein